MKNWYSDTTIKLKNKYGEDYKIIAGLIASTSPRFDVKRNFRVALELYNEYINNKSTLYLLLENKDAFCKCFKILGTAHYNNIKKVLYHDFQNILILGGNKVNAFYNNLIGNLEYVTIDVWILRYFKVKKSLTNNVYNKLAKKIKKLAQADGMRPAEYQAILWTNIRTKYGKKPICFSTFI